jgi:hypothetical protein
VNPFVNYYGGKHRLAKKLGEPKCNHVIEPFAGFAGFSVLWEPRKVTLIDVDPVVIGVWKYLQRASQSEILDLPGRIMHVDDLPSSICEEAKWFIGFWLDHGQARPSVSLSNWGRNSIKWSNYWGPDIRRRIAGQVDKIRRWKIIEGSYEEAPDVEAHWHIDPPYHTAAGRNYRFHNIDYGALAQWCLSRRGFVQVCEAPDATWLPFRPFAALTTHRRGGGYLVEWIYECDNRVKGTAMKAQVSFMSAEARPHLGKS